MGVVFGNPPFLEWILNKYDCIIWDFNGTLLDDVRTGIDSVNTLLAERGLPIIESEEYYRRVFRFPIIEYYRSLGFDFDSEPYEVLAPKWVRLYLENVKRATLFSDVRDTLEYFRRLNIRQVVLSATERSMLEDQLNSLGIRDYFEEVMGLDDIHAGSKLSLARAWRERNRDVRALLIGDTDHDVENAREMGADCVLVARGHQSEEHLKALDASVVASLEALLASCF